VAESFLQVLLLAKELRLVKLGVVSVDGSKFDANASKHRAVTYQRAGELIDQLKLEIADLLGRAEAADASGEEAPQALPKAIAARRRCAISWTRPGVVSRPRPRRAPRRSGRITKPRWRRARSARVGPRASTRSRRRRRRVVMSRATFPTRTAG
jgi:hypothetical protein